jgi:hypothetical protein
MSSGKGKAKIKKPQAIHLLESGSIEDLKKAKESYKALLKFHWNYYSELARQRHEIQDQIQEALVQTCVPYEISKWQRAVKYKYGLHPLSSVGSLTNIGGRFNTGGNVNTEVPSFAALYIAA